MRMEIMEWELQWNVARAGTGLGQQGVQISLILLFVYYSFFSIEGTRFSFHYNHHQYSR
jgi:hypothetical protein